MAHLLGGVRCLESLRDDVADVQAAVDDVISRVGPPPGPSWKYPDQSAADLDIKLLLEEQLAAVSEGEEDRQVSHVVLLELVIDRLLFFIKCMSRFSELSKKPGRTTSGQVSANSIGPAVKQFWRKMAEQKTFLRHTESDLTVKSRALDQVQRELTKTQNELDQYRSTVTAISRGPSAASHIADLNGSAIPPRSSSSASQHHTGPSPAKDNGTKACQTYETAFAPCEACARVQGSLHDVGDSVQTLCRDRGLPSSLARFRKTVRGVEWLTANDVGRWGVELGKDVGKIQQHQKDLQDTVEPLKTELVDTISQCRGLANRVTECEKLVNHERETRSAQLVNHQRTVEELNEAHTRAQAETVREERERAHSELTQLAEKLTATEQDLGMQKSRMKELVSVKEQLLRDLEQRRVTGSEVKVMETRLSELKKELGGMKKDLQEKETALSQQKSLNANFSNTNQTLQDRNESLVKRIEELDEESESVQEEIESLQTAKDELEARITEVEQEKDQLSIELRGKRDTIAEIESEKATLEHSMKDLQESLMNLENTLKEQKEQERLLLDYPDINGPVNPGDSSCGDIAKDMESQVNANMVRIELLEQQNETMVSTIQKLMAARQQGPTSSKVMGPPTQLWKAEDTRAATRSVTPSGPVKYEFDTSLPPDRLLSPNPTGRQIGRESQLGSGVGRGGGNVKSEFVVSSGSHKKAVRPSSGTTAGRRDSGFDSYKKLKDAGLLTKNSSGKL